MPKTQTLDVAATDCLAMVMCTDGLFRLVATYSAMSTSEFLALCRTADGVEQLFDALEWIESQDADAQKYPRLKIRDDATVVSMWWGA